tara:strand:+ start:444 stop:1244 length:801 start_codon:yes stop_codon:yes gene_type:complete
MNTAQAAVIGGTAWYLWKWQQKQQQPTPAKPTAKPFVPILADDTSDTVTGAGFAVNMAGPIALTLDLTSLNPYTRKVGLTSYVEREHGSATFEIQVAPNLAGTYEVGLDNPSGNFGIAVWSFDQLAGSTRPTASACNQERYDPIIDAAASIATLIPEPTVSSSARVVQMMNRQLPVISVSKEMALGCPIYYQQTQKEISPSYAQLSTGTLPGETFRTLRHKFTWDLRLYPGSSQHVALGLYFALGFVVTREGNMLPTGWLKFAIGP